MIEQLKEYFKIEDNNLLRLSSNKKKWSIVKLDGAVTTTTLPFQTRKAIPIARVVYSITYGEIPEGYMVVRKHGASFEPDNLFLEKILCDDVVFVGSIWKTNYHGNVEVISFNGSKKITVKFLDCGATQVTNKDLLEKGQITPKGNGRIKIRSKQDFEKYFEDNKNTFELIGGEWSGYRSRIKIGCTVCKHTISVTSTDALHPLICKSCNPSENSVVAYSDFISKLAIPDGWKVEKYGEWRGVSNSKIKLQHDCGTNSIINSKYNLKFNCVTCNKINTATNNIENKRAKHYTELMSYLDMCNENFNHEYEYDISPLLEQKFIWPYKSKPIRYVHKPCGTVIEKSLSYHLSGGPDGRGVGCPVCADFGYSYKNGSYLYIVVSDDGLFKVGITKDTKQRLTQMNKKSVRKWSHFWFKRLHGDLRPLEKEIIEYLNTVYEKPTGDFDGVTESFILHGEVPIWAISEICKFSKK